VDPDAVVLAGSTSEAYAWLLALLADPGDAVLVPRPSYPLFDHLTRLAGVTGRAYPLVLDGRWTLDRRALARAARAARPRSVVVVAPGNPTGAAPSEEEWDALEETCVAHGAALVVDEVFADYAGGGPTTAARRAGRVLTFTLGGLSKSCGLPQLKVAWIGVHGPPARVAAAVQGLELIADTYLAVATPTQAALPHLLALAAGPRAAIQARVAGNRAALAAALGPASPATLLPGPGAWSAIVRLPGVLGDEAWALTFLHDAGIFVHPGYFFDLPVAGCVVASLLPEPDRFAAAMAGLLARVARETGGR
jgi:aspartate/methionine/tyrosine aminotransferase